MNLMAKEATKHASLRVKGRTDGWNDHLMARKSVPPGQPEVR
jgi:hypothetical protein